MVLKDPVSQKFFRLSLYEYRFLKELDGHSSLDEVRLRLEKKLCYYSLEDVELIVRKAAESGLVLGTAFGSSRYQMALKERIGEMKRKQRLSSVYFLFIPILNPDRFLEKTLWIFNILWNRLTGTIIALASIGALYLIIAGIPKIKGEYLYFFNLKNMIYLWITIAITKLVHEFAHAYTAKRYGLHVPQMGIAFLIFFPCLYCNTTDAWSLARRKERMAISGAGVISELSLAILAIYVWYFSKPGLINSLSFYLMGVSLISTLFFNGNPLLKFDGYFVLTDYLRKPNLYSKSFAQIKYMFMNLVLGDSRAQPAAKNNTEKALFTFYGISSFIYRIFLYIGIIAGVYYRFDKTIGIILAALAFGLFVARPIIRGISSLFKQRNHIYPRPRGALFLLTALILGIVVLAVPLPRNSVYPCYVDSDLKQKMTVPLQTWISRCNVQEGQEVQKGDILYALETSALELRLYKELTAKKIVELELKLLLLDEAQRAEAPGKLMELLQAEEEITRTQERLSEAREGFVAPFSGVVTSLDPRMKKGFQPGAGEIIGALESTVICAIHGFVPEEDLDKLKPGDSVSVRFNSVGAKVYKGSIHEIKPFSEDNLKESPFSSRFGGELATEITSPETRDTPLEAQYDCVIQFNNPNGAIPLGITGRMIVSSRPESIGKAIINKLTRTFNRESLL